MARGIRNPSHKMTGLSALSDKTQITDNHRIGALLSNRSIPKYYLFLLGWTYRFGPLPTN
jgi:hypothetical protein